MENTEVKQEKSTLNPRFIVFMLAAVAMEIGMFMVNSSVSLAATEAGADAGLVGIITSVSGITSFLIMIIAGPMTLVAQPNILMGIFVWCRGLGYLMYSFYSIPLFIVAKILDGIAVGFLIPSMLMLAGDMMNLKDAGFAMGLYQARNSVGKVIGPMLGANGIALLFGYVANFRAAAALYFVIGCIAFTFKLKNTEFTPQPFKLQPKNIIAPGAAIPFVIVMFFCMPQMALGSFNMVYVKTVLGVTNVGVMMSVGNLFAIFVAPFFAGLCDKLGIRKGMCLGVVLYAIGPVIFSLANGLPMAIVAACFQYVGFGSMAGVLQALLIRNAPPAMRGVAGNVYSGGMNLGSFFGPIILGYVVNFFGYKTMYLCCLIPLAICFVLAFLYANKLENVKVEG